MTAVQRGNTLGLAALSAALSVAMAGCGFIDDYRRPAAPVPDAFPAPAAPVAGTPFGEQDWRSVYPDPRLAALIDEALAHGPDGLLAAARAREAEAAAGITRAAQLPNVGLALSTSPVQRIGDSRLTSTFLGGVTASWDIDLWGRYALATRAARADFLASTENLHAVRASLVANVANLYYSLAALHALEVATRAVADTQRDGLALIRETSRAGINSAAEERQQESALAATEANVPPIRQQIVEAETALAVLLGRTPGALGLEPDPGVAPPAAVPSGLPSALIERRPDIRAAEAQVRAAHARAGVARAMFFPDISLTGVLGGVSTSLADVLHGRAAPVASLGPSVLQPLFAGGALVHNREAALARLDQAIIGYRKTVNAAFGEVGNDLSAVATTAELVAIEERRVTAAREAQRLAELRFRAGVTGFLELLDAQRQRLASETDLIRARLGHRQALISLYLALGGGWDAAPPG